MALRFNGRVVPGNETEDKLLVPPEYARSFPCRGENPVIQIELENGTTFRRRIFLRTSQLRVTEPIPLALTAWKYFDLGPGASTGTVDGWNSDSFAYSNLWWLARRGKWGDRVPLLGNRRDVVPGLRASPESRGPTQRAGEICPSRWILLLLVYAV